MLNRSKFFNPSTAPYFDPKSDRRVVLLTGGNSGIGWFTALHLYLHGYVVYVGGRTESKVLKAIDEIKTEADKRVSEYPVEVKSSRKLGQLKYLYMDLLDLQTVSDAADKLKSQESKLHILINNAGIMGIPYQLTKDGYEIQYQVNFVSHFLLTLKLLPLLKNVANEGKIEPRVVNLASIGHNFSYKYFHPSDLLNRSPFFVYTWFRYGNAKVSGILGAKQLAKEEPEILSLSVHPGIILGTDLYDYWLKMPVLGIFTRGLSKIADAAMGVSVEEGCLATLKAAMDPTLNIKKDSGKYLVTGGPEGTPNSVGRNPKNAKTTWDWNVEALHERGFEW
ncbi:uncharacterized protein RJT21DRAFT_111444 [Scheffersomyces amazonensis]|uniref:uncharacterized protein n=1 Tax=Scheffersomyces amazonensis TaxID=1078765 RepID=UPI00315CFC58